MKTNDSKIQYYVDAEKGVVIAKLNRLRRENYDMVERLTYWDCWIENTFARSIYDFIDQFPDYYVGVAKCYSGDTFDEELGKKIARARLLIKVNNTKAKVLHYAQKTMMEAIGEVSKIEEHHLNRVEHFENELEDTLGKVEG